MFYMKVVGGSLRVWVDGPPTYSSFTSPPHTRTLERKTKNKKKTKTSIPESKERVQMLRISHVKNVNKGKNRPTPAKLESKRNIKK